jgi:hypothetical protein
MDKSKARALKWGIVFAAMAGWAHLDAAAPATNAPPQGDPFVRKAPPNPPDATWGYDCNLVLTLQAYDVGLADANLLLQQSDDDQVRYDKVRALAKGGKAHLIAVMAGAVSPGEQLQIEEVGTIRYPIAFSVYDGGKRIGFNDFKDRGIGIRFVCKPDDPKGGRMVFFFERGRLNGFLNQQFQGGAVIARPQFAVSRISRATYLSFGKQQLLGTATYEPKFPVPDASEITFLFEKADLVPVHPPIAKKPDLVAYEFSLYSMPPEKAVEILNQKQEIDSAYRAVQALVKSGDAKLEHLNVGKIDHDESSTNDEVTEHPYPTLPEGTDSATQDTGYSTNFKSKFVGSVSLEFHVLDTHWTRYLGELKGQAIVSGHGSQPVFETSGLKTSLNSSYGEHELMGTFNPCPDIGLSGAPVTDRVWLEFVRTTAASP